MRATEVRPGQFISRDHWGSTKQLAITRNSNCTLVYINKGNIENPSIVGYNSTAYEYNDFYLSDEYGNKLPIQKEKQMKHDEIKYIVTNSKTGAVKYFESEEDRDDYIEEQMDLHTRVKFMVFEPTYKVEPKRPNLKELFKKIKK